MLKCGSHDLAEESLLGRMLSIVLSSYYPPENRSYFQKVCGALANLINAAERPFLIVRPSWIHVLTQKEA